MVFSEDLEEMLYDDFDWAEYNGYDVDDEDWDETDDCDGTRLIPAVLERPPYRQSATTKVGGLVSFTEVFAAICCPEPDEDEWVTDDELSYPPDGFLDATNISSTELATVVYPLAVALLYRDAKCRIDDYVARECKKLGVDHYNTDVTLEFGERSNKWCVVDYFDYPDYAFYESCAEFVVEVCTLADISTSEWRSFYHINELGDTGKTRVKLSIPVGTVTEETRQKLEDLNSAFNAKMAKHKKRNIFDGADLIFN